MSPEDFAPPVPAERLARIESAVREILAAIGEDPNREGLLETPARVARMYFDIFSGMREKPEEHLKTRFHMGRRTDTDSPVLVRDIPFFSVCEHHLLPVRGMAHLAYLPREGAITGLSKLVRLVEGFARRPQLQERMTDQIADALMEALDAQAALVRLEAEHFCISMRGVQKPGTLTVTFTSRGLWAENPQARAEIAGLLS